jgi:hypothetical protein
LARSGVGQVQAGTAGGGDGSGVDPSGRMRPGALRRLRGESSP